MIIICDSCGEKQGEKEPLEDKRITHGKCQPCADKLLKEIRAQAGKRPKMLSRSETEELLLDKKCPDCHGDKFLGGPEGGCSVNIKCDGCGSKFNVCPPFFAERIN